MTKRQEVAKKLGVASTMNGKDWSGRHRHRIHERLRGTTTTLPDSDMLSMIANLETRIPEADTLWRGLYPALQRLPPLQSGVLATSKII